MVISLYLTVVMFFLFIFFNYKKRLHLYEIFFIWMTVWIILHSVSSILLFNLHVIALSERMSYFIVYFLKRLFLHPLIIIVFFDLYARMKKRSWKFFIILFSIISMSLTEFIFIKIGVIRSTTNNFFLYSLSEWTFTVLTTFTFWIWYRKKRLMRE
ncbi:hypothetical protein FA727_04905 [Robertmurraya kyonggiensis]|uniref:Uncharacterized protein n=2 Tax=Robertmurraya kyonggiensis TaxID=1037680 RepID=A0A4U1D8L1_9BACI|nr:hypothetical protein FA727_04905 [Robertmurraya kyonggiensis]